MRLDLDLVLFDFHDAWEEDQEAALEAVQLLLLRESACRARIQMLRRLETRAPQLLSDVVTEPTRGDFSREVHLLVNPGLFPAVERRLITPERLSALTRDPDALWAAHQALNEFDELTPSDDRPLVAETADTRAAPSDRDTRAEPRAHEPTLTELAHSGHWDQFEAELHPWLSGLLHHVGLHEDQADELMQFIMEQARRMGERRFSDLLPEWLEEFGRVKGHQLRRSLRSDDDWREFIDPSAFRLVLQRPEPQEPEWAARFRDAAIQSGVSSVGALVSFEAAECAAAPRDTEAFRQRLLFEISAKREVAKRVFERD